MLVMECFMEQVVLIIFILYSPTPLLLATMLWHLCFRIQALGAHGIAFTQAFKQQERIVLKRCIRIVAQIALLGLILNLQLSANMHEVVALKDAQTPFIH